MVVCGGGRQRVVVRGRRVVVGGRRRRWGLWIVRWKDFILGSVGSWSNVLTTFSDCVTVSRLITGFSSYWVITGFSSYWVITGPALLVVVVPSICWVFD
ncbi:hypothetical protein Hanom_Chr03g00279001 [Helianthus anomalus]